MYKRQIVDRHDIKHMIFVCFDILSFRLVQIDAHIDVYKRQEDAIDSAAAIPVILPVSAISLLSLKASVKPASATVNSTLSLIHI